MKSEKCSKKQADVLITPEKVKTFILNNIVLTKDRNIQEQISSVRNLGIIGILMGMFVFYIVYVQGLPEGIDTLFFAIFFYVTILLSIFLVFRAIKRTKKTISNINKIFDEKKVPNRKEFLGCGGTGGLIGLLYIGPRLNLSENATAFSGIALGSFFILLSTFSISHAQYNLYLLKKYCPEIANLKADNLIPKKKIIPKNKKRK